MPLSFNLLNVYTTIFLVFYTFKRRLNEVGGRTRYTNLELTCNSDSDVFRSAEVPSRPMQNQNVNVNA